MSETVLDRLIENSSARFAMKEMRRVCRDSLQKLMVAQNHKIAVRCDNVVKTYDTAARR
jgi:hypothetical protein